jgi:predicted nuclease of predicted toxin-antitoxin system
MKLLVDVSLSPQWIEFLKGNGFDAVHWSTVGSCLATDREIFDYAAERAMVVFTRDLDFGALLAERKTGRPSVIQVRCQDVLPDAIGMIFLRAARATQHHLEAGALVTVDSEKHRVRILPFS